MTTPQLRGSLYIDGKWCEADSGNAEIKEAVLPALGKGVPIFGFYAWGELGRIQGRYQGMDHQYQQHTFVLNLVGIQK